MQIFRFRQPEQSLQYALHMRCVEQIHTACNEGDGLSRIVRHHRHDYLQNISNLWSPIDKVTAEHSLALSVTITAVAVFVIKTLQQFYEFVCMSVYIANDIVDQFTSYLSCRGNGSTTSAESTGPLQPTVYKFCVVERAESGSFHTEICYPCT